MARKQYSQREARRLARRVEGLPSLVFLEDFHERQRAERERLYRDCGARIRYWRQVYQQETLRGMAQRLGYSAAYLSDVERGNRPPDRVLVRILSLWPQSR